MQDQDCIFCKIIKKEIPSEIIKETENVLVIKDISPKAPIHYLILPKKHIRNLHSLTDQDATISYEMLKVAQDVAKSIQKKNGSTKPLPFNLLVNNEAEAGQCVFHLHWHFISGKNIFINGSKL